MAIYIEPDGLWREISVAVRSGGLECEVEPSRFGDQAPDIAAGEHLGTAIEDQALGNLSGVNAGIQLAQGGREPLQIRQIPRRRDVGVAGEARKSLQLGGEGANQHELDLMAGQRGEQELGIEWNTAFR